MKVNQILIGALMATTCLMSCDKDDSRISENNDGGISTALTVSIKFPSAGTRSTDDPFATEDEAKVNTVDVFIYNTNNGSFSSHKRLTAADFKKGPSTSNADVYEYNAASKIPTTTGSKSVFAGVNLPSSVVDALKKQPASNLTSVAQIMTKDEFAGNSNFAMFSVHEVKSVFEENPDSPANKVTLTCQRLVAKVTVETDKDLETSGVPGKIGDLKFAINNFNTKIFMLQGAPEERKDPNWSLASYDKDDFIAAKETEYVDILRRTQNDNVTISSYKPRYASENTSEGKRKKEITRVSVRATFIPRDITEYKNKVNNVDGYVINDAHGVTTAKTFYALTPSVTEGTFYFFDQNVAKNFANDYKYNPANIVVYTNGYCYWDIFLNKVAQTINKWDVLRNDFYKCNITRIVAPGRPDAEIPTDEIDTTPETDTSITANIEILFWNTPILSDYVLE